MKETAARTFLKLSESDFDLAETAADVRGNDVIDSEGENLGSVKDLLLDDQEHKVRFLEVEAGGFLGIGSRTFVIPVDAIKAIGDGEVILSSEKQRVIDAPEYDPDVVHESVNRDGRPAPHDYWGGVYNWYGYSPYWAPDYRYPGYPYYPAI